MGDGVRNGMSATEASSGKCAGGGGVKGNVETRGVEDGGTIVDPAAAPLMLMPNFCQGNTSGWDKEVLVSLSASHREMSVESDVPLMASASMPICLHNGGRYKATCAEISGVGCNHCNG